MFQNAFHPKNLSNRVRSVRSGTGQSVGARQALLIIARQGLVSDALNAAVERAFPWLDIHTISEPGQVRESALSNTQLILIDLASYHEFSGFCDDVARSDPSATVAVMAPMQFSPDALLVDRILSGDVRGVLPTDVNLDIWLSIIQIMLKGGEYIPPNLLRALQGTRRVDATAEHPENGPEVSAEPEQPGSVFEKLTTREREVLRMVAQGHQNKIIAADLKLSENTIKIHIHNIIKKLGVHNRTEAAALFIVNERQPIEDA